jgi:hypothetical protein
VADVGNVVPVARIRWPIWCFALSTVSAEMPVGGIWSREPVMIPSTASPLKAMPSMPVAPDPSGEADEKRPLTIGVCERSLLIREIWLVKPKQASPSGPPVTHSEPPCPASAT